MPYRDYNAIRLTAYRPDRGAGGFQQSLHGLAFPAQWRRKFLDFYRLGKRNPDWYSQVPIRRLNEVLHAVAPDLITVARNATLDDSSPWLYAQQPFPITVLRRIILAWIRDLHREPEYTAAAIKLTEELDFDDICWEPATVDLLAHTVSTGGTAIPDPRIYQLLPDALARQIIEELGHYDFSNVQMKFRIAPSRRGSELVSWPPREHKDEDGTWWFSFVMALTVHTIPFEPDFRVHVRTGVRRWCGPGSVKVPYRRSVSAFMLTDADHPWLEGAPATARFAVGRFERRDSPDAYQWTRGGPEGMLQDLRFATDFPKPADLQANPGAWMTGSDSDRFGVVHSTAMGPHGVGAGLMPRDRAPLSEWAEQAFGPALVRITDHRRGKYPVLPRNATKRLTGTEEEKEEKKAARKQQLQQSRREGIARVLNGEPLSAVALWQNPRTKDALVGQFCDLLGLDGDGGADPAQHSWTTPELKVHLRLEQAGVLATGLEFSEPKPKVKHLPAAITRRRSQASGYLGSAQSPAEHICVIEIGHADSFRPSLADPKFALRLGCADAGCLTQFINLPSKARNTHATSNIALRAASAWLDTFRQLGVRIIPEPDLHGLPEGLHHVALWMVRRRADGPTRQRRLTPVAVRVAPDGTITGWDPEEGGWIPYRHLLLALARQADIPGEDHITDDTGAEGPADVDRDQQQALAAQFIKAVLYSLRDHPTLLLTHAQNTRGLWPWLTNSALIADMLQFGASPPQDITTYGDRLRHIRVRDHAQDETPQWYAPDAKDTGHFGFAKGLWLDPEAAPGCRTFLSTIEKASTAKWAAVGASKISTRDTARGTTVIDTDVNAWNPGVLELAVVGVPTPTQDAEHAPSEPELWATLVHQLRYAPDYRDVLGLPLHLHLAKLAAQYVLPHADPDGAPQDTTDDPEDLVAADTTAPDPSD